MVFLPINPSDEEDVINYIRNVTNIISINYKYEQYQFAYFGIHLLLMTYIYCTAWKISQIEPERYRDAIVFARSYAGRENDLKIEEVGSIFSYSLIPEKDIAKFFKIIDLDKSQVKRINDLVSERDFMAHATGQFEIVTEEIFSAKAKNMLLVFEGIHRCMIRQIRKWYSEVLLSFCKGEYDAYDTLKILLMSK
jgi:hypothetical protein